MVFGINYLIVIGAALAVRYGYEWYCARGRRRNIQATGIGTVDSRLPQQPVSSSSGTVSQPKITDGICRLPPVAHDEIRVLTLKGEKQWSIAQSRLYDRFRIKDYETRFLELLPDVDQVRCKLHVRPYNHCEAYDAVSYHWGNSSKSQHIYVEGVPFDTPDNLYDALTEFRLKSRDSRMLWVDKFCINQADNIDKDKQLKKMHLVYSQARTVLIWLGTSRPGSEEAAKYFQKLDPNTITYAQLHTMFAAEHSKPYSVVRREINRTYVPANERRPWFDFVEAFLHREWWSRAWIVQESMLAKNPLMFVGSMSLPFDLVLMIAKFINSNQLGVFSIEAQEQLNEWKIPVEPMTVYRRLMKAGDEIAFGEWIANFQSQSTTDLRDRVLAFLGLGGDAVASKLRTGSNSKLEEVWADVTRIVIQGRKSLDFLLVGRTRNRLNSSVIQKHMNNNSFSLPSWVPDFTCPPAGYCSERFLPVKIRKTSRFDASGGRDFTGFVTNDLDGLFAQGIIIDIVSDVSLPNVIDGDFTQDFERNSLATIRFMNKAIQMTTVASGRSLLLEGVFQRFFTLADLNKDSAFSYLPRQLRGNYPTSPETYADALNSTLVMDLNFAGARLRGRNGYFKKPTEPPPDFMSDDGGPELSPQARQYAWNVALHAERNTWTAGRSFITTSAGYIGIAPPDTKRGDIVMAVSGASVPLVFKEEDEYSAVDKQICYSVHILRGECYLHGFMDGEAYNSLGRRPQNIIIR